MRTVLHGDAARSVISDLLSHLEPVLSDQGDRGQVEDLVAARIARGNGAFAQRATFARIQNLGAVVLDAVADGSAPDRPPGSVLATRLDPHEAQGANNG